MQALDYTFRLARQATDLDQRIKFVYGGGDFRIQSGESPSGIANQLKAYGYISNENAFVDYLVYKGFDTKIRAGQYQVKTEMNIPDIATLITDFENSTRDLAVLAGWRQDEVAAALELNGINVSRDAFLKYLGSIQPSSVSPILEDFTNFEGLLFPGSYTFSRSASPDIILSTFVRAFLLNLTEDWQQAIHEKGLSLQQAIILASIVERESMVDGEDAVIASVFYNRLRDGMRLESDPTVQYSLGFQGNPGSWWKSPLSLDDLEISSSYNTYKIDGLPPTPICSPGISAIHAVAFPKETNYYYFRARCDGSGLHNFSESYQGHINNACP
jgi:UPF0755 protein